MAAEKKLELRIVPSSIAVNTDRSLLRRLVQNLVSNAIKYTRQGRVLVGVRRRGELIELQVIDTGIGIAPEKLGTVFREFTRLDEGAREAQGLGLGLSIVDRIARVLRLEIRIFSEEGKGTRFSVILPADACEPAQTVADRPEIHTGAALEGLAVFCIDNDPRILDSMRLLLERWDCRVWTFAGSTAFEAQRAILPTPDVVLADFHLDGENGLDTIRKLRAIYGAETAAVLITADRSSEVRAAAEAMDVPVINKPVKPAALRSMITRVRRMAVAAE
jgi:CheY-like chemotaxis protein/anti-sigma regulatory factor (Ser/Thr protein kinase)